MRRNGSICSQICDEAQGGVRSVGSHLCYTHHLVSTHQLGANLVGVFRIGEFAAIAPGVRRDTPKGGYAREVHAGSLGPRCKGARCQRGWGGAR